MIKVVSPNGTHVIQFGGETIPFTLEMRQRRRLSISVYPDRRVTVLAPAGCSLADVLARVQKRAAWITRQRAYFEQFHPLPHEKRYVSGATHLYLGRQYRLKIQSAAAESVKLTGSYLHVATAHCHDALQVKRLLDNWYRSHAKGIFHTRLLQCAARYVKHLGCLTLGEALGLQIVIPLTQRRAVDTIPALVAILVALRLILHYCAHSDLLCHLSAFVYVMAKDGEVAFSFQPSVVSSYCLAEVVIETKWPTR